jgi:diguanylate cyclase (GGDEF)-like protein/PAS domain S-box-containing protein
MRSNAGATDAPGTMHKHAAPTTIPAVGDPNRGSDSLALGRQVAPFALAGGGAIAIALFGTAPAHPDVFLAGILLSLVLVAAGVVGTAVRLPLWMDTVNPLVGIALVGVFRHGAGPAEAGLTLIVLVPILWLSVFASRRVLVAALILLVAVLAAPIALIGAPDYPPSEWRHAGIIALIALFAGFTIQTLVQDVRAQGSIIAARESEIAAQAMASQAMVDSASDAIVTLDPRGQIVEWNHAAHEAFGRSSTELVGRDFIDDLVVPDRREALRDGLRRIVAGASTDRERRFETSIIRADGGLVPVEVTTTTTNGPHGLRIHAFARDISDRRLAEEAAASHAADLGRLLNLASELGRAGTTTDDRSAICRAARELADADVALFFEPDAARGLLIGTGRSGEGPDGADVELNGRTSMTATVFASGRAEFIPDLMSDPRVDQVVAARLGTRSALLQPIVSNGRPLGVLVVYWWAPRSALPDRIASVVALFAAQAAAALDRASLLARLEDLARTDALTGAANRRALEETLVREIATAERKDQPLSVIMLDLDRFKDFNDRFGHPAGDSLLQAVARAWRAELRPSDTLARYGGEEFLIVLPDCDPATSLEIANRLRDVVPGDQTVSAGVASWSRLEAMTELIARADAALYDAKRGGRDRACVAESVADSPTGGADGATRPSSGRRRTRA